MKKAFWIWLLAISVVFPAMSSAQEKKSYISVNPGLYYFTGDLDDEHPSGFYGDLVFGHEMMPNLFIEGGIGYLHDGVPAGNDVRGYLLHIGAKKMFPVNNRLNLFLGAGLGAGKTKYQGWLNGEFVDDEEDGIVFAHFSFGADVDITSRFFLGIEGKYLMTSEADYRPGVSVNLDGFAPIVRFGFRF